MPTSSTPMLQRLAENLAALPASLATRLGREAPASRLGMDASEQLTWTRFRHPHVLSADACMEAVCELEHGAGDVLAVGVGEGSHLTWLLEKTERVIYAWDPDLSLWRHVLSTHDWAEHIRSGRLVLLFGLDLLHCAPARDAARVVHPDFREAYADADSLLRPDGPVALMVQGELFVDDVARELRVAGYRVLRWDVPYLPPEEHTHILCNSGAVLAVAINTVEGLPEALEVHRIPLAVWEIDPNTTGPAPVHGPADRTVVFSYRTLNIPALRRAGYRHVEHLPLAAPTHRLTVPATAPTVPIAFVGASMAESAGKMQAELRSLFSGQAAVLERLSRVLAIQRQNEVQWKVPQLLETICPGLRARIRRDHDGLDIALLLGEICAAEKRLNWLSSLGSLGLHVWGDPGWSLARKHGVKWEGWADHFVDLPRIYASAAIHVDVPRLYQQDAVAMRVFDVLGAGGFLLAEYSPELVALFRPGTDLDTYRTPQELQAKCRFYLEQPELRRRISQTGRARVHSDHTIGARVGVMIERMRSLATAPASSGQSGR